MKSRVIRTAACSLAALLTLAACSASEVDLREGPLRPNIVFILADDLGYGDLGCYGQQSIKTPHLDRMAAEGLRFTQHYAGSTVCAPSRACLLAGQHTGHVHQRANGKIAFRDDPDDVCVASLLRGAGYATAMIGKSGLACNDSDALLPNRKGFDHFFGFLSHGAAHRYYPRRLFADGRPVDYPENDGKEGETYSGDLFLDDALAWIERHRSGPFFLHLALQQPHFDLSAPDRWRARYLGEFDESPIGGGHYRAESHPKATYAAMVSYLDDSVGRVIERLNELGIAGETLVLFASDNGPATIGEWSPRRFESSGALRGGKRDLYEGGVRVPMIALWPGVIRPGRVTHHASAFWDFAPTACELAGCESRDDFDGISYLPTLTERGEQREHDYLYWEFYERGGKQAVRRGDWKAVRNDVRKNPRAPIELYDLRVDLSERRDVAAEHPAIVARLASMMREAHTPTPRFTLPPPEHPEFP